MPERKLITKEELIEILSDEIKKIPECEGVKVRLRGPTEEDATGCNWVPCFLEGKEISRECKVKWLETGDKLRAKYNLK